MIWLKVVFLESDSFLVFMRSSIDIGNRSNLGVLLKQIGLYLKKKYHYIFSGLYHVDIYQFMDYYVFEIEQDDEEEDDMIDFNVSFHPNSLMLFRFSDEDYVKGKKYFWNGDYYVEFNVVSSFLDCLEFGNIIYKQEEIEQILKESILIDISSI